MIRLVELMVFIAPLLALVAWQVAVARGLDGPAPRQLAAMLGGLLLLAALLALLAVREALPPGVYVPAQVVDGRVVPGHTE